MIAIHRSLPANEQLIRKQLPTLNSNKRYFQWYRMHLIASHRPRNDSETNVSIPINWMHSDCNKRPDSVCLSMREWMRREKKRINRIEKKSSHTHTNMHIHTALHLDWHQLAKHLSSIQFLQLLRTKANANLSGNKNNDHNLCVTDDIIGWNLLCRRRFGETSAVVEVRRCSHFQ